MTAFLLLKLPFLPLELILQLMNLAEILNASMCSKRTEELLRNLKYKLPFCDVHLKTKKSQLVTRWNNRYFKFIFNKVTENSSSFSDWNMNDDGTELNYQTMDPIEDSIIMSKRIRSIFQIVDFDWTINIDDQMIMENIAALLPDDFSVRSSKRVSVFGGSLDSKSLTVLMNKLDLKWQIRITSSIPLNFKHRHAFHFESIFYRDARWMLSADLLAISKKSHFYLGATNFDCNDMNRLLHYWLKCNNNNKRRIFYVKLKAGTEMNEFRLFDRLEAYRDNINNMQFYILTKENILAKIKVLTDAIELWALSSDDVNYEEKLSNARMLAMDEDAEGSSLKQQNQFLDQENIEFGYSKEDILILGFILLLVSVPFYLIFLFISSISSFLFNLF